jgi:nucleoside 2-deoxyribosyltransferase
MTRHKIYLAAPLFSLAERSFNLMLERQLSIYFDVFLPRRDNRLFVDLVASGLSLDSARDKVFDGDISAVRAAEVFLIVLDGRSVDEGASFELGVAYALGKTCVGLQTDPRRLLPLGNNPMLEGALSAIFHSVDDLMKWALEQQSKQCAQRDE